MPLRDMPQALRRAVLGAGVGEGYPGIGGGKRHRRRRRRGFPREISREASRLASYASSPAVERHRCASCQSPVYATLAKGKMAAVPLAMLDAARDDAAMAPTHRMYYGDRIMDVPDHLPKYVKSAGRQAELWKED